MHERLVEGAHQLRLYASVDELGPLGGVFDKPREAKCVPHALIGNEIDRLAFLAVPLRIRIGDVILQPLLKPRLEPLETFLQFPAE